MSAMARERRRTAGDTRICSSTSKRDRARSGALAIAVALAIVGCGDGQQATSPPVLTDAAGTGGGAAGDGSADDSGSPDVVETADAPDGPDAPSDGAAPSTSWVKTIGTVGECWGRDVALDSVGNVVLTGTFQKSIDFGDGPRAAPEGAQHAFVVKYAPDGGLIWVRRFEGLYGAVAHAVTVDDGDQVIAVGAFIGVMEVGGELLEAPQDWGLFVAKLDGAGEPTWGRAFVTTSWYDTLAGRAVATDSQGNIYVGVELTGAADFGQGELKTAGSQDVVVLKLDPAGGVVWSKQYGHANADRMKGIAVDPSDRVVFVGNFFGTVDFGAGPVPGQPGTIVMLDGDGNLVWQHLKSGTGAAYGHDIAIGPQGSIHVTGSYFWEIDLGGGMLPKPEAGKDRVFLLELDPAGQHVRSKGFLEGGIPHVAHGIAVNGAGSVGHVGSFNEVLDLGGGPMTSSGGLYGDFFMGRFDAGWSHVESRRAGDEADQEGLAVVIDPAGNMYATGIFEGTADFGTGPVTSQADQSAFLAKFPPP